MLASPAHLYMPHLFTHCLPTIICVMLMSIAFFFNFCYMLLFVTPFWIVCVYDISLVSLRSCAGFSVTSLWCTLVNPFLVVHPTQILVHHRVHFAHRLKSAGLWDPRCLNDKVILLFELHQAWRIGSLFLLKFLIVNCAFFRSGDFYEVIQHNSNNA